MTEAGCQTSSFNRKSFSSQLSSQKGNDFLLNAIEGRNHYKACTLATAFQNLKDWAHACGVGCQADRVTPWDCLPPTDRASLSWDQLNKAFREPKNRHPDWEEGMVWNCCHGHWEHPPNAIVAETEALVSSLDTAVWESIGQCHHTTDDAHVQNLSNNNKQFYDFEDIVDHVWVGSRFYFEVKWKDGTSTLEPESRLKEDDPHTLAFYLQRSGLSSRSKRCQWANSAIYTGESTGGGSGSDGSSVNFSSEEEETKSTLEDEDTTKEASRTDASGCNDAKFFAVRSFGTSCTLNYMY